MLFNLLFLTLIYYSRHYISEYAELIEVTHLKTHFECKLYLYLAELKNNGNAFEAVCEKLGQVVVKVVVHKHKVFLEVVRQLVQVKEDLLEVLFDQSHDAHKFNVAQTGNVVVCN